MFDIWYGLHQINSGDMFLAYGFLNIVIGLAVVAHHDYTEWKRKQNA